jgi:hypothetical protein
MTRDSTIGNKVFGRDESSIWQLEPGVRKPSKLFEPDSCDFHGSVADGLVERFGHLTQDCTPSCVLGVDSVVSV